MAKFQARCANQILVMKPARNTIQDGIIVPMPGEKIEFQNGEYDTTDKKEIDFIKKHRLYGSSIVEVKKEDAAENGDPNGGQQSQE